MPLRRRLCFLLESESEDGSQTVEYVLLIMFAAAVVVTAIAWAKRSAIAALLDAVLKQVKSSLGIG